MGTCMGKLQTKYTAVEHMTLWQYLDFLKDSPPDVKTLRRIGKTMKDWFEAPIPYSLNNYQEDAKSTAVYPAQGQNLAYPALGLTGEAGEVADKIKKIIRDQDGQLVLGDKEAIAKEIGDVLWYCAILADELGVDLETVAKINISKLQSRKRRGVLGGSGDER